MSSLEQKLDAIWRDLSRVASLLPTQDVESNDVPSEWANIVEVYASEDEEVFDDEREQFPAEDYLYSRIVYQVCRQFQSYVERRHIAKVQEIWGELEAHVNYLLNPISPRVLERVESLVDELREFDPVLILSLEYPESAAVPSSPSQLIEIPKLIVEVNRDIASIVARDPDILRRLSPRAFEEFIAEIFSGFGYQVELTAQTRDGGKDLVAVRNDHGIVSKVLVECKRFSPTRKIGMGLVRQLYAVKQLERASKALLVTTSYFSKDARAFERQHLYELELKDFEAVTEWVKEYERFVRRASGG